MSNITSTTSTDAPAPEILHSAGSFLAAYDVLFCDVWGVVHDGMRAYPSACDALTKFRAKGGTVILVSNAPVPRERVARMLDQRGVPRDAWDHIVSSGEIALAHLAEKAYATAHFIGPRDRDAAFFSRAHPRHVELADAEAIVCTGLTDDTNETPSDYVSLLETARARDLPFICANPDLVVDVGGRLYHCAGALADLYANLGGHVFYAGKPHASAYNAAAIAAQGIRGTHVPRERILVIGDSVRTDMTGAHGAGLDALFIAAGIHRHETMDGPHINAEKLSALFGIDAPPARIAMPILAW